MQTQRSFVDRIQFVLVFVGVLIGLAISAANVGAQTPTPVPTPAPTPEPLQVTNTTDTDRTCESGNCSLREAIKGANDSDPDRDTISFDPNLSGDITLTSELDPITDSVAINGSTDLDLTVDGNNQDYIFSVSTGTTTVKDLALEGAPLEIGDGASLSFDVSVSESDPSYEQQFDDVIRDVPADDPPTTGGALIKKGDGTLTLRGANTYTGGTTVSAGTLRGDMTSLQGDIGTTSGALLVFDQINDDNLGDGNPDNDQYTGVISGTGKVQKTGAGTVVFSGSNTYSGGTTISEGSLRGDAASLPGDIAVESGGTVIFKQVGDDTYAGNLTGAGELIKRGVGTLTLSGTNTISGESSLDEGALLGDFASIPRKLATLAGTSVTFDHETNGTYAGDLSGAGDFNKLGTGTLTLSGTNTISGLASLDAGALQGDFEGIPLNLSTAADTSVIFNHANNGTYAGAIGGDGDVTKSGSGTLSLTGINTFMGLTTITSGRLNVDAPGSLAGSVIVGSSAVLGGTGSITGPVTVDGTVAPGNSIGTLSVGSILFASGSVFEVEMTESGTADKLMVTGDANLAGGSVLVVPGAGSYAAPVTVTIVETTGGTILNDFASYGPDLAFLTISSDMPTPSLLRLTVAANANALSDFAETPNQETIADAFEEAQGLGVQDIDDVFDKGFRLLTESQVPAALDAMTGETLTQFATARLATAQRFGRSLDARIRDHQWGSNDAFIIAGAGSGEASDLSADPMHPENNPIFGVAMLGVGPMGAPAVGADAKSDSWIRTWIDGSGIYGDVDGNSNESAFDYTIWGGSLGTDVLLAEHWVLGLAGGYANTDLDFSSRSGDGEIDTYQGALYAGYVDPRFHVGVSGRYAYNDMEGKREIRFGDINRKASADLDGDDYGARFEGGVNLLDIGGIVLQPTTSLNYNHLTQDDVTESGADSLNLALEDYDLDSLVLSVGMRVRARWKMGMNLWIVPELHGRWLHEFLDTDRLIEARLVSAPVGASAFQIQGVELPRDSGSIGFAWSVITDSAWSLTASYDAILNEDLMQHVGSVALNFEW